MRRFYYRRCQNIRRFADVIDRWIVTQIPIDVDGADTFMPADFTDGFEGVESKELTDGLTVETFHRQAVLL